MQVVSELDLLFAKAAFAGEFDCVIPTFAPENERRVLLTRRAPSAASGRSTAATEASRTG